MKNPLHIIAFSCISVFAFGQGSVPNGNFESWATGNYEAPTYYSFTTNSEVFLKCKGAPFNVVKSTDAFHGTYSAQITTVANTSGDTCMGAFLNAEPGDNFPNWPGGIPYNQKPTGIRGYYKCNVQTGDTARWLVIFKQGGTVISYYGGSFYGTKTSYTLFNVTFNPPLSATPDTVIFAAASSDFFNDIQKAGSMLKLDSISFTGVVSQPATMNGSFELWQNQSITMANDWDYQGDPGVIKQTNDKAAGNYAIELITFQGENKSGNPRAYGAQISNGYCYGPSCVWMGGYPFINQIDTLMFSYKYAPMSNDSASVEMVFKKNGSSISMRSKNLGPSTNYQVVQVPFNIGQAPDTVIIRAQSSLWRDSALTYVGSVLKIDEIHFKSQPLTTSVPTLHIQNSISIYPNPSTGEFNFQSSLNIQNVEVYNTIGVKVISKSMHSKTGTLTLNEDGIYFIRITSNGKTFTKKLVVNK